MFAAQGGSLSTVKLLLDKGTDAQRMLDGRTALNFATDNSHKEIAQLLREQRPPKRFLFF